MADFNVDKFYSKPSVAALEVGLKKIDWINLGLKYEVSFKRYWTKAEIVRQVVGYLVEHEIVGEDDMAICEPSKETSDAFLNKKKKKRSESIR